MKEFGPLYAKSSTGKIKVWNAVVTNDGILHTSHGFEDGKLTSNVKEIKPKNVGKSNETSAYEQACNEAQSKMNKKKDEGYVNIKDELDKQLLLLPMLAHPYEKRKHNIEYPAYVQPKLNGVRCLATINEYFTRKGKTYNTLEHLDAYKNKFLSHLGVTALDGEIFHPEWTFQEIIRNVKKIRSTSKQLQYWVYDIIDADSDFDQRTKKIKKAFEECSDNKNIKFDSTQIYKVGPIVYVPTIMVQSEKEMMSQHKKFTSNGFEGTIIRNIKGKYELKNRSKNLQKYKDFIDAEFDIVDGTEATGNDKGTVIFICKAAKGTFSVRPKGSRETRKKWLRELDSIIGKQLTVRYQELSEEGIPIFPVGLAIRDYED